MPLQGYHLAPYPESLRALRLDTGMGRMLGCRNINSMCIAGSRVPSCSRLPGLQELPATETVNKQVRSICEEMTMDGCEQCMPSWQAGRTWADCDLLRVYSQLCYAMPEMGQCGAWHSMCQADPGLLFCSGYVDPGSGSGGDGGGAAMGGPVMKMYFFEDLPFYLLFKSWTPSNHAQLAGAWFAVFAMGLLYELLQMLYGRYEADFWAKQQIRAAAAAGRRCGSTAVNRSFLDVEAAGPVSVWAACCLGAGGLELGLQRVTAIVVAALVEGSFVSVLVQAGSGSLFLEFW
eukprot:gene12918-13045_t